MPTRHTHSCTAARQSPPGWQCETNSCRPRPADPSSHAHASPCLGNRSEIAYASTAWSFRGNFAGRNPSNPGQSLPLCEHAEGRSPHSGVRIPTLFRKQKQNKLHCQTPRIRIPYLAACPWSPAADKLAEKDREWGAELLCVVWRRRRTRRRRRHVMYG